MAENQNNVQSGIGQQAGKRLDIKKIYVKDISFEALHIPDNGDNWSPHLDIQLHNSSTKLQDNLFEVSLQINITASEDKKTIFAIEVSQAGTFEIVGADENETMAAIQVHCPHILFPFARETIASLLTKGGYPQLLIGPINFDAIFNQSMQDIQSQKQQSGKPH